MSADEPEAGPPEQPSDDGPGVVEGLKAQLRRAERLVGSGVHALGDVEGAVAGSRLAAGDPG
ncbi:MAG: hypothetical protein M3011_00765 [Actinomycetota bacterium]|nr:hypothetical protein [Actinomycetota bacterium]